MPGRLHQLSRLAAGMTVVAMLTGCVAGDGTVEYETSGGTPSLVPAVPGATGIAAALAGLLSDSGPKGLARFSAPLPPPDAVTCKALTIGCEGGLGPIHHRSAGKLDFSGFEFIERRRGVSLAERREVSSKGDEVSEYRALAGWLDHGFFLIDPPGLEPELEAGQLHRRYHGAYSVGRTVASNPDVLSGGTATWSGIMAGFRVSDPDAFVNGDALISVSGAHGAPGLLVDVAFTNIRDERGDADLVDVSWTGIKLENGSFGVAPVSEGEWDRSRHPARDGISGRFYGPSHEEVGGLFSITMSAARIRTVGDRMDVSGAFGAKRDE